MKFLIIGSTSVIGRALKSKLASVGTVYTAGRRSADFLLDLAEWRTVPEIGDGYDVVIHVAADFSGQHDEDLVRAEVVNAVGTLTACRLAQKSGAHHFVLISTFFSLLPIDNPYFGSYALSKRHAEEVAQLFCANQRLTFTVLRPSQVYDMAGECRHHQPLLYAMVDHAENGEDIVIYGNNDAVRNYIYLDDVVEIVRRVVDANLAGTFNCLYPRSVRLSEIANATFAAFSKGGGVQFDGNRPDLADITVEPDAALYDAISFVPEVDIVEGMRRIQEHRERLRSENH